MSQPEGSQLTAGRAEDGGAGWIRSIELRNFMCHASLKIDFIRYVNFITGANGSGKSAILTALCVAFGTRAKTTGRASTMKDFIRNGCSSATVSVELSNEGPDAFKQEVFGQQVTVERTLVDNGSSRFAIKDERGRKVRSRKEDVEELAEHFNIDVDNPCIIMSQDKSREFLHVGTPADKFRFFVKATLLERVSNKLTDISEKVKEADVMLGGTEALLEPMRREREEVMEEVQAAEELESAGEEAERLKRQLAWGYVYDLDAAVQQAERDAEGGMGKVRRMEEEMGKAEEEKARLEDQREEMMAAVVPTTEEMQRVARELEEQRARVQEAHVHLSEAQSAVRQCEGEMREAEEQAKEVLGRMRGLRQQEEERSVAAQSQHQVEMEGLQERVREAKAVAEALQHQQKELGAEIQQRNDSMQELKQKEEDASRRMRDIQGWLRRRKEEARNKVLAFGGERVLHLLRGIEERIGEFEHPPIGPVGMHLSLEEAKRYGLAAEIAVGKFLNTFLVSCLRDYRVLRSIAQKANISDLSVITYDFSMPPMDPPADSRVPVGCVTLHDVLKSTQPVVRNVLLDQVGTDGLVLVRNYDEGKPFAFAPGNNVRECICEDGMRMFCKRGQTVTLPYTGRIRSGRLGSNLEEDERKGMEEERHWSGIVEEAKEERKMEEEMKLLAQQKIGEIVRKSREAERERQRVEAELRSLQRLSQMEEDAPAQVNVTDLEEDLKRWKDQRAVAAECLPSLRERLEEAEQRCGQIGARRRRLEGEFQVVNERSNKVQEEMEVLNGRIADIVAAGHSIARDLRKAQVQVEGVGERASSLKRKREVAAEKASAFCSEEEGQPAGGAPRLTVEALKQRLTRLLRELPDDYQLMDQEHKELLKDRIHKLTARLQADANIIQLYRKRFKGLKASLDTRKRNMKTLAKHLSNMLNWEFQENLKRKAFTGSVRVDYDNFTLNLEVDARNGKVTDVRSLSGGERSFSTLCFALALHHLTEAPFRAVDEFDIFMDNLTRRMCLHHAVQYAIGNGSQWLFITPHDIGAVDDGPKVKKQKMHPPRHNSAQ